MGLKTIAKGQLSVSTVHNKEVNVISCFVSVPPTKKEPNFNMTLITECAIHPYNHTRFLHTTHQLRNMTFSASQHEEKNFDYLMKSWLAEERKKGRNQIVSCDKNFVTRYAFAFKTGHSRKNVT